MRQQMRDRAYRDLSRRSMSGTTAYLLIWLLVTLFYHGKFPNPEVFWVVGPLIVVNTVLRIVVSLAFGRLYPKRPRLWKLGYFSGVALAVAAWDYFLITVFRLPELTNLQTGLLIATAGLCAGGVSSFSPDKRIGLAYPAALLVPAYVQLITAGRDSAFLASLIAVYYLFLVMLSLRQNAEYRTGLRNQIELERRKDELEVLNITDALTQIYNRYYFDEVLEKELGRLGRESSNLALILIDVDHFKLINDSYGHPCGDEVLRELASLVGDQLRRVNDFVARYGGEEFAILLPATELDGALSVAEKLRLAVQATRFGCGEREIAVTVSLGVACTNRLTDAGKPDLIMRADLALYAAKRAGRNRVEAWTAEELEIPDMED